MPSSEIKGSSKCSSVYCNRESVVRCSAILCGKIEVVLGIEVLHM